MRTSSPRQKPDRPVVSVELRISFLTDEGIASRIKELFPSASLRKNGGEIEIVGEAPVDVADRVRELLGRMRKVAH